MEWLDRILDNENAVTLLVASIPLLVAVLTWSLNQYAAYRRDVRLRREKKIDVMRALRAEIKYFIKTTETEQEDIQYTIGDFRKISDDLAEKANSRPESQAVEYIPFVPSNKYDEVYRSFLTEIQILPEKTIEPVVTFYSQVSAIQDMGADMRSSDMRTLSQDRINAFFYDYLRLILEALKEGKQALTALETELGINKNSPADSMVSDSRAQHVHSPADHQSQLAKQYQFDFGLGEMFLVLAYFTILYGLLLYFQ